jgi:hypothetical protein
MLTCARCGTPVKGQAVETPMGWMHAECAGAPTAAAVAPGGGEALGTILVLLPLLATALIWFWVGSMNLFQNPSGSLTMLTLGTIVGTAIMIAVEAGQLGMGTKLDARGKPSSGPVVWFLFACLLWIVAFPWYLDQRRHYGRRPLVIQGIFIGLIFVGSAFAMGSQIEAQKSRVRDSLQQFQNRLGG